MKLKALLATSAVIASVFTISAHANDAIPSASDGFNEVGKESGWTIYVDDARESCLMQKTYEGQHVVQVGHTKNNRKAYLGAFAKIPDEFRGKKHTEKVTLVVGEEAISEKKIKRSARNADTPYTGAYVETDEMAYFMGQTLAVQQFDYEGEQFVLEYNLDGIAQAAGALKQCEDGLS